MGPISPWIPRPAATSLNPISESTFPPISLFLFDLLQNARHLGVWGFRITSCPRRPHGCCARQWRTVGMSSQPDIFICHPPLSQFYCLGVSLFISWDFGSTKINLSSWDHPIASAFAFVIFCFSLAKFLINNHKASQLSSLFHPPNPRLNYLTKETTGLSSHCPNRHINRFETEMWTDQWLLVFYRSYVLRPLQWMYHIRSRC